MEWVAIYHRVPEMYAHLIKGFLAENNVECRLQPDSSEFRGKGAGQNLKFLILVPQEKVEQAIHVLQEQQELSTAEFTHTEPVVLGNDRKFALMFVTIVIGIPFIFLLIWLLQ